MAVGLLVRDEVSGEWVALTLAQLKALVAGAEESQPLDIYRVDIGGATYTAEAKPGTAQSAPAWRVMKTTYGPSGSMSCRWAGSGGFAHTATDAELPSHTYGA